MHEPESQIAAGSGSAYRGGVVPSERGSVGLRDLYSSVGHESEP